MTAELIAGKYEVLETIGRGGMGTVYKARQRSLDRIVAVKMLSEELAADVEFRARFQQEATLVARLSHPNIVAVYDIEPHNHTFCIIMEYLEGENLQQKIDRNVALSEREVMTIGAQVARALNYAHAQGIVHRDVKPDNIHVTPKGVAKVMDFGIARFMESKLKTQTGISMGTPKFMSPEQVTGKNVDSQSDLYSLGVCLYYCIAGRPPFEGENAIAIATRHLYEQPIALSQINTSVSPSVEKAVMRALEKSKAARYATGNEMAEALEEALEIHTPIRVSAGEEVYAGVTQRIASKAMFEENVGAGNPVDSGEYLPPPQLHTPSERPRSVTVAAEGMVRNAGEASPSLKPAPSLEDFSYSAPVEPASNDSSAADFVRRWWTGIGALLLIAAGVVYIFAGGFHGGSGGGDKPEAPSVEAEFATLGRKTDELAAQHKAPEALELLQEFKKMHPDFNADKLAARIDLITAQLPLSQPELLAVRRNARGTELTKDFPPVLARAYQKGADELYKGLGKPNPQKKYLGLTEMALASTVSTTPSTEQKERAKAAAERGQKTVQSAGGRPVDDAEKDFMEAVKLDPKNGAYWIALADYYKSKRLVDDARVMLESPFLAYSNSEEKNAALRKLEELNQ